MDGFQKDMRMKMVLGDELIMMGTSKFNQRSGLCQDIDNTFPDVGNQMNYFIFWKFAIVFLLQGKYLISKLGA